MKIIIKVFIYNFVWLLPFSSFSQEPTEAPINIKVTEIEEITDYYVYRVVKYNKNIQDTIIMLADKSQIKNHQDVLLKLNSHYEVNYKEKIINSLPILGGGAVFDIVDNVRIAELYSSPKIITNAKELHHISEKNYVYLNVDQFKKFENFLHKFTNDNQFRSNRVYFSNTLEMSRKDRKRNKKTFKNWGEFERILKNYKTNNYKRDKINLGNSNSIFFRLYDEQLENDFWYIFTLDKENNWQLTSFFKL